MCVGPDGRLVVASGSVDSTVRLWDLSTSPPRLCWASRAPAQHLDARGLVSVGSIGLQPQQLALLRYRGLITGPSEEPGT